MHDAVVGPLRVCDALVIPAEELGWRFSRSSGPGGQGVNTADSRVELSWTPATSRAVAALPEVLRDRLMARVEPSLVRVSRAPARGTQRGVRGVVPPQDVGAIVVVAAEHRAQLRNREAARRRLAQQVREALAPPARNRRATRPTRGSVERRLRDKAARSALKAERRSW